MDHEAAGPFPVQNRRGKDRLNVQLFASYLEVVDGNGNRGKIPLDGIRAMRLNYAPATNYAGSHHVCQLTSASGENWYFRADEGYSEEQQGYRALVNALHARFLAQAKPPAFLRGMGKAWLFWAIMVIFGACLACLEVAVVVGTAKKGNYLVGAIFLVLIPLLAYFLFRFMAEMARPGAYDPQKLPIHLIP